ncbi:putative transposase [Aquisalimonas asiatica]|uniref:Putative transposase n=1 Tax=Aquisalimonas asiatica TaxID=406100 RepID=A0A1H8SZC1_9GAMM|nr:putative transposase [Aquisalimonas asiatica]
MRKSRFSESEIVAILKEADAGMAVKDVRRKHGISQATYYNWRSRYGGMEASDLKRMKELQEENRRLKQMYADLSLENTAMKDLINRKL